MNNKSALALSTVSPTPGPNGNGNAKLQNEILMALPDRDRTALSAMLEFVDLPVQTVLNEAEQPIKFAYFINAGLASILIVLPDGKRVEVGLTGKEGFVGFPLLVGFNSSPTRVVMQIAGTGSKFAAVI